MWFERLVMSVKTEPLARLLVVSARRQGRLVSIKVPPLSTMGTLLVACMCLIMTSLSLGLMLKNVVLLCAVVIIACDIRCVLVITLPVV